jgi:glyoxylase-like metal-dependent hydrolase (beta-lactamase superfamily II)
MPRPVGRAAGAQLPRAEVETSINACLVNTGTHLVLVDTGAGKLFGPGAGGRLQENIRAAGYAPEQVDAVLITHVHGDHPGGLAAGGRALFPNATVYVSAQDAASWFDPAHKPRAAETSGPASTRRRDSSRPTGPRER